MDYSHTLWNFGGRWKTSANYEEIWSILLSLFS